jgi:hypothetical protein
MIEFYQTMMGKKLIEGTLPDIAYQLKRIADALEVSKKSEPLTSSLDSLAKHYPNDTDLGREIRKVCQ